MTQLDKIENMLTELIKASRQERAEKRKQELDMGVSSNGFSYLDKESVIRNIIEFGGDIN